MSVFVQRCRGDVSLYSIAKVKFPCATLSMIKKKVLLSSCLVIERNFFVCLCTVLSRGCIFLEQCQSEISLLNTVDDKKSSSSCNCYERIFLCASLCSVVEGNVSVQYCQGEIPLHRVVDDEKILAFVFGNCFKIVFVRLCTALSRGTFLCTVLPK